MTSSYMQSRLRLLVVFLVASAGAGSGATSYAGSTAAEATATMMAPVMVVMEWGFNFGRIASKATAGTIVLGTGGEITSSDYSFMINSSIRHAQFVVFGEESSSFSITLPTAATLVSGNNSMIVDGFTSDPSGSGTTYTAAQMGPLMMGPYSQRSVRMGATLHVGAHQPAGAYQGTFSVSADYN
jgi:hypothetical protein